MEKDLKEKSVNQLSVKKKEAAIQKEEIEEVKAKTTYKTIPSRQPMLILVCGETGVGKTFRNFQEFEQF